MHAFTDMASGHERGSPAPTGSREPSSASIGAAPSGPIALQLVDCTRNRKRLFAVVEVWTLFGEPSLLIRWGRLGGHCRVRAEVFDSLQDRSRRRRQLLRRRRRHGYGPGRA